MSAQEIIKLIETVDPSDTARLDEIDLRVWSFVTGKHELCAPLGSLYLDGPVYRQQPMYTRSRDALKAIRPEGWFLTSQMIGMDFSVFKGWFYAAYGQGCKLASPGLPTEELAELHAIISAIEWDRNNEMQT